MINLYLGNHTITGKKTLFDWIEWLSCNFKINEIGFTISNKIDPKSINIIFDNFFLDSYYYLKKYKIKYGIIETEYPINDTFNNINNNLWKARRYSFDQVAKNALFIWSMGKWVDYEGKIKPDEIIMSYTPQMTKFNNMTHDKIFDFVFTGPVNSFRTKILKKFEKYSNLNVYDGFLNRRNYEKCVLESKYYLCLQQTRDWPTISISKMMRALHNQTIPILLNSKSLENFEMAKFSINIDSNINRTQIQNLLVDYNKNLKICSEYKNFKWDNFKNLKKIIHSSNNYFFEKKNILFPNYNLTQPTKENRRNINKLFKLQYVIISFYKWLKKIINKINDNKN